MGRDIKFNNPLRKRKVLHIVTAMTWRGGEQQVAYLLEELDDQLQQIVACMKGSVMEEFCRKNGHDFVSYPKRIKLDPGFAYFIKRICSRLEIDLCHLHDAHAHTIAIMSTSIFRNNTPLILSRRVDFPIKKSFFSKFKYNHSAIKKILCVSDTIRKIISPDIHDRSKIKTVYSGIDLTKFKKRTNKLRQELQIRDETFLIGNTSALADHKDYFTFIDTAKKISEVEANCHFIIIGDGPMKQEIMQYSHDMGLDGKVHFTGFRKDLPEILADLDLFLITSKTEGLGTSILDAFACGVPVVGTAGGGITELIVHEETGLLCPVGDVDCLGQGIQLLKANPEMQEKLVNGASSKVSRFSKKETARQTFQAYDEVWL